MIYLAKFILISHTLVVIADQNLGNFNRSDTRGNNLEYTQTQQGTIWLAIMADADDDCSSLDNPPPWCVFQVQRDGRVKKPDGEMMKDWSGDLKEFQERHPKSPGPVFRSPGGERYRLKIK